MSVPLRYHVAAAMVGLNVIGVVALATFAFRTSRETLEQQATLAVEVAARAREESLIRLLEGRRDRLTAFLGSLESLCGERVSAGPFDWEPQCVRVAVSGFQTAERALAVELRYRARRIASRGTWTDASTPLAPGQLTVIDAQEGRGSYIVPARRGDLAARARYLVDDINAVFSDRSGLEPRGEVFLTSPDGTLVTAARDPHSTSAIARSRVVPAVGGGSIVANVQRAVALIPIQELARRVIFAAAAFMITGTVIAMVLARATTGPMARLAASARALEAGHFDEPVPIGGPTEVRQLGRALSSMATSLGVLVQREKEARLEAEAANRTKDDFLAMLSHELRTPLTAILGWSSIMLRRGGHHPLALQGLDAIERSARTQARLVDELLDVSRIVSGKLRLTLTGDVSIVRIVDVAVEAARPSADAKRIEIVMSVDSSPCLVTGDAGRLQQVMANLLSNAVRFTPEGGRIEVSISADGGDAVDVRVKDSGVGIAPDFLPHVFERFRQADSSTTRAYGGLGLGLAIARHIVELHGGTIRAESVGPGFGATFVVRLPRHAAADAVPTRLEPVRERSVPPLLEGVRILVVDDDRETRDVVRAILEEAGAVVATTESADQTRALLRRAHPDMIIADIGMPSEDGYSLMRSVRQLDSASAEEMPAIALTAHVRPEDVEEALASGFQMHLPKPIDPTKLLSAVTTTLLRNWPQ